MRRLVGLLLFAAALTGAVVSDRGMDRVRELSQRQQAAGAAAEAARRSKSALGSLAKEQETRVLAAANLPQLVGQLSLLRNERLDGPLAATLADWFASEPPWEPFRREFSLLGVSTEEGQLGLVLPRTEQPPKSKVEAVLAAAREGGVASGFIQSGQPPRPMLAAAARVVVPSRDTPVVLFLARPLDQTLIATLASRVGAPLLLERSGRRLASAGAEVARGELERAVQSVSGNSFVARNASWAAAAFEILPGLQLWSHASVSIDVANTPSASTARISKILVWSVAGLVMLAGLFLVVRPTSAGGGGSAAGQASAPAAGPAAGQPADPSQTQAAPLPAAATVTRDRLAGPGPASAPQSPQVAAKRREAPLRERVTAVGPPPGEALVGPMKNPGPPTSSRSGTKPPPRPCAAHSP